ncbi:MAG: gene transfer agent family protein [Hyphomicrobiaceae bacterium]
MANRHRGEIEAVLDGKTYTLCLTLGALAELEQAFGASDLTVLAGRFGQGRMSARDAIRILTAGLRATGHDVSEDHVAGMQADGAAVGFVTIVARLLAATFADTDDVLSSVK